MHCTKFKDCLRLLAAHLTMVPTVANGAVLQNTLTSNFLLPPKITFNSRPTSFRTGPFGRVLLLLKPPPFRRELQVRQLPSRPSCPRPVPNIRKAREPRVVHPLQQTAGVGTGRKRPGGDIWCGWFKRVLCVYMILYVFFFFFPGTEARFGGTDHASFMSERTRLGALPFRPTSRNGCVRQGRY